uniref:Transmembrane protein n=1 Tax=Noccaea caerulescens TaxID=107243 RepID=A0A1J3ID18_NOCCA
MLTLKPLVPITLKPRFSYNIPQHRIHFRKSPLKLKTYARNGGNEPAMEPPGGGNKPISSDDENGSKKDGFAGFSFKWGDLLNPDQDNFVAIGLAGVLTWASLQVLSQLFFISFAILVAALKYSFIAALLIFILVTLL